MGKIDRTKELTMASKRVFLVFILSGGLLLALFSARGFAGMSEARLTAALTKGVEVQKELYEQFLPVPEDLGPGWLLPWKIPASFRKYNSEDEFWQFGSGSSEGKLSPSETSGPPISLYFGVPPEELDKILDATVSLMEGDMPMEKFPPGLTRQQFFLALALIQLRMEISPSLAKKMELMCSYLEEMLKIMKKQMEAEHAANEEDADKIDEEFSGLLLQAFMKPVQGMSAQAIKRAIVDEVASVENTTSMVYAKCDDWTALKAKEADPSKVHLGQVSVRLTVFDRDIMTEKIDDLEPEEVATLNHKLNQAVGKMMKFAVETEKKEKEKEIEELKEDFQAREESLQEEIREMEKRFELTKKFEEEATDKEKKELQAKSGELMKKFQSTKDEVLQKSIQQQVKRLNKKIEAIENEKQKEIDEMNKKLHADIKQRKKQHQDKGRSMQEQIQEVEEESEKVEDNLPGMEMEVYTRDFGDNCYVVNMTGRVNLPEEYSAAFPFAHMYACLRNGNAVVTIRLDGNFALDQFRKELDHFLSEMDARTAFFRE